MHAAVLRSARSPLVIEDLAQEEPRYGEVAVRMGAAGVCASDAHVMHGTAVIPMPCVLGHEGAGTVEAVGPGVTSVKVGDRCILSFVSNCGHCRQCITGNPQLCDTNAITGARQFDGTTRLKDANGAEVFQMSKIGVFAERIIAPAQACFPIPDEVPMDVAALMGADAGQGETLEARRQALVMKLGENISVRRFVQVAARGVLAYYLHGSKIGVLIDFEGGDEQLGRDLSMHIAASNPQCVLPEQVAAAVIAREREIYSAQAKESGKPEAIVAKMVDGRIAKFLAEVALVGQPFVKNPDQTVAQLLAGSKAKVHAFHRYMVGEGIERKKEDFAAEVMAQVGSA